MTMARRRRRRVSLGTIFMLLLTALVVVGCVLFFSLLVGDDLYERTGELIRSLSEQGLFDASFSFEIPEPTAVPAYMWLEDTPVPTPPPATPTPVPAPATITIAAAGAVYAPKAVRESVLADTRYDFEPVFSGLGDTLLDADLAIATLETTTAGRDKGFDNHNTAPEILDALRSSGVDLLSLATEHALDKGYEGLDLTVSELTARGLAYAGVQQEGGGRTMMMRIGGVQVAVLAYTYGLSDNGREETNGDERGAVPQMNREQMLEDVRQARVNGANVVIVLPHWGTKNIAQTPVNVQRLAGELAQAGADIILGTHPNVPQGTERIRTTRADGLEYDTVVCYSLGNLLTDARAAENTAGMVAHVSVTYDPVTRRTTIGEMYCTPVYIARQRVEGENVYRVVDAESETALQALTEQEQQAAREAVELIRRATQADEQEGHG
ncbi:MAG: CapA family protein [Clostridiales bacterium]|nr:CapA family protein [Clostridiales bacterium]